MNLLSAARGHAYWAQGQRMRPWLVRRYFEPLLGHYPSRPRGFALRARRKSETTPAPPSPTSPPPPAFHEATSDPLPKVDDDKKGPEPLSRPIGIATPPEAGENTGIDLRSWKQRRDDFVDYDKHLKRRKELTAQISKPYFRDWSNMRYQQGKVFIAPSRVFRADKARYFPNLRGITAAGGSELHDTTDVLAGHVSLISVYTGTWAERQTATFVEDNVPLQEMLAIATRATATHAPAASVEASPTAFLQHLRINVEPNRMRYNIVRWFLGRQRRLLPPAQWSRYFVVHRGFEQRLREQLGMFNAQVGYVFLVDRACRVRWAGSAEASAEEAASLSRAVVRLSREYAQQLEEGTDAADPLRPRGEPAAIASTVDEMASVLEAVR